MGHVLGIGTLWGIFNVERDPLPGDIPDLNRPQPFYIGTEGVRQFSVIKGSQQSQIAIENGFNTRRNPPQPLGIGPGSVGGHFDKDELDNELMTFSISSDPRLSIVSIGSLADFGYFVDLGFADSFVDPFPNGLLRTGAKEDEEELYMVNDILFDEGSFEDDLSL